MPQKCHVLFEWPLAGFHRTVELGYNDHGYNEFTDITNKILRNFWSQMVTLLRKAWGYDDVTGYNEQILMVP